MEALLQNLHEQQLQLQQNLYTYDLANMENVDGKPPPPPPRKYVSIFCIDGEPILPPLMTLEKREQMQRLKERAVVIEKRLAETKQHVNSEKHQHNEVIKRENSLHQHKGNISQRSQDYNDRMLQETEESMDLLKNLLQRQLLNTDHSSHLSRNESNEKLQKLRKSEILIFDNFSNEVIQVPAEKEQNKTVEDFENQLRNKEHQTNIVNTPNKKPSHLLLAGINGKGVASIPSICLNPPTPLTVDKKWCDTLSIADSSESILMSENPSQSLDFSHDLSSDESFNSMITQSNKKPYRNIRQDNVNVVKGDGSSFNVKKKPITPEKNVCAKIQQFEAISSENNTPQTSPVKVCKNRKICLGTPSGTMNRSATSPSIKINTSNRSSSSRSQSLAQDSDISPESNLVRSSSFTLEGPSAALIEHMQQQEAIKVTSKFPSNTTRNLAKKSVSAPLRAHRDTVESKAKKVQKVEFKSPKLKPQPKTIPSKLSQAAAASLSPYNSTTPTQHTSFLCKTNRSPSHTSPHTMQKSNATQMRKSNSTSSYLTQTKSSKPKIIPSSTSASYSSTKTAQTGNECLHQMDKKQKEKFLHLLAKQEQEHRRLQQVFELQQKILTEQLRREMAALHLKSPNNSSPLSSITSTSQQNKNEQLKTSSPRNLNQKCLTSSPLDHSTQKSTACSFDLIRHKTQPVPHQSPPSLSTSSPLSAFDRNQSKNENSHQNASYSSHYTHSPQPIPLNNSHLSLMDHSNANTSLDISTISLQTSPDTPKTQTNTAHNNTVVNKNTPSSRRRLFSAEINGVNGDLSALTSRSTVSTPNAFAHGLLKAPNHPIQYNHSNGNNRRDLEENNISSLTNIKSSFNVKKKPITPEKNVCAKIQQFEAISSENNTPQTSPVKVCKNRKICLGTPSGTMNRSATSPSIKINTSNRSSSSRSQSLAQDSDISPESNLVRSSSFTLEGPSAALIEHMQQQEAIKVTSKFPSNTTRNLAKKSVSAPLRAHRDTVESKAKKVQKVEFKSPKLKPQPKTIPSKLSQAAAASLSPYNSTTPTQHTSFLCKTNRSPSHTSPHTMQKSNATQMRKSNSTSSYLTQTKSSKPKIIPSSTSASYSSTKTAQTGNECLHQMDKKQKEKFLHLLAKQEQEHRRLQQVFELQQKILTEQLRREMAALHLKSPNNSSPLSSITSTSQQNKNEQLKTSSPRNLNQKCLTSSPLDHSTQKSTACSFDLIRHKTQPVPHQSPPSLSTSSPLSAFDRNQSKNENSHQNASYSSHYTHSPQPIPLNNSHLSLMDHSNANTSLDISTISLQTSPDTPKTQTNTAHNNTVVNKNTPSSRRRLFSAEINGVNGDLSALTSRSTVSTPNAFAHGLLKAPNHPIQYNHSNGNNRRASGDNSYILHNAATKINAVARGFLVRRLFQTEQIQRIVQTIHDTLIFVLNLHIETIENPEEAQTPVNIKLKARLLQQLSSACRTLHLVFFQTSVKERMEIIARDRKRIKNKLMMMNSKRSLD